MRNIDWTARCGARFAHPSTLLTSFTPLSKHFSCEKVNHFIGIQQFLNLMGGNQTKWEGMRKVLKGERFSVEGGEIQCWRGRDSVLKGERFSVEGGEIQCWKGRDSVLKGERFSVEGGEIQCWRGRDIMLKGERFSVEGGEIQCWRGKDSELKGEIFSVEVKSFLKIIFYKTIATSSFIKPIKVLEKNFWGLTTLLPISIFHTSDIETNVTLYF